MEIKFIEKHTQFHTRDDPNTIFLSCRYRLLGSIHGIMVGDRYSLQTGLFGHPDQCLRRIGTIRKG